jgi:N-acetylmuramoyl-L-alanine amidase
MIKSLFLKKKPQIFSIFFLLILLCLYIFFVLAKTQPANMLQNNQKYIIVIDPGHGGIDGGAVKNNVLEKNINLDTALKLRTLLTQKGYSVVMTREEDVSLEDMGNGSSRHIKDLNARVEIINNSNAGLFVSIHTNYNANKTSTSGSIVFYNKRYEQNSILAYDLQRALNNISLDGIVRAKHNPVAEKYYILDHVKIPGALVEIGFLSNTLDKELLNQDDFRQLVAEAITAGIEEYFNKN